ncbi:MAG TPA: hypothetical protein VF193_09080 [Steroidobacter sp.]
MVDPMDALVKLQEAVNRGSVALWPGEVYPDLGVWMDAPLGRSRVTYAKLAGSEVQAVALFFHNGFINNIPCFQTGYAVVEAMRRRGMASQLVAMGIEEMRTGLRRNGVQEFYVEAVVGLDNTASNNLARRLLSEAPERITDQLSGEPALRYVKLIQCN